MSYQAEVLNVVGMRFSRVVLRVVAEAKFALPLMEASVGGLLNGDGYKS